MEIESKAQQSKMIQRLLVILFLIKLYALRNIFVISFDDVNIASIECVCATGTKGACPPLISNSALFIFGDNVDGFES